MYLCEPRHRNVKVRMNSTLLLPPELNTPPEIKYKNINKTNSDTPASKKMVPEQYSNYITLVITALNTFSGYSQA